MCKTTSKGEALLDRILENTSFTETFPLVEPSSYEEAPLLGTIDFKLGRETFSLLISRAKNSPTELLHQPESVEEVMAIFHFVPSE